MRSPHRGAFLAEPDMRRHGSGGDLGFALELHDLVHLVTLPSVRSMHIRAYLTGRIEVLGYPHSSTHTQVRILQLIERSVGQWTQHPERILQRREVCPRPAASQSSP